MNKRLITMIFGAVVLVAGFLWLTRPTSDNATSSEVSNHVLGQGSKGVTVLEYADFQCPACKTFYPVIKQVKDKYANDIFFQYRHYPLEAIHQNARASARAAEAAHKQGKFWEMHDTLFENQDAWSTASDPVAYFKTYAQQIGVPDIAKFEADLRSSAINAIVNADLKEGQKLSITSTPTFVVDGTVLKENPSSLEAFYKIIDDAIAKKAQAN